MYPQQIKTFIYYTFKMQLRVRANTHACRRATRMLIASISLIKETKHIQYMWIHAWRLHTQGSVYMFAHTVHERMNAHIPF